MGAKPSPIVVMSLRTDRWRVYRLAWGTPEILTMALHDTEELDDDLRGRADENLALATALSVDDVVLISQQA